MGKKLSARFSNVENKLVLKYYFIKYLKLYLLWTGIYLPITLYYYIFLSDQSAGWMIMDFFRGLIFRGEHWNSWMLWYLLSMIYALLIFSIIRHLKGSYCAIYIISFVPFILSVIYENCSGLENVGGLLKCMRGFFGESGRLFTAPFYLSVGMIFSQKKNMTFKSMIVAGVTLTTVGFLIKLVENNAGQTV